MGNDTVAAWDIAETQRLIDHPAVRLLRSQNAALTLTFLHRAFKENQMISVPESHLRARLENFLDEARSSGRELTRKRPPITLPPGAGTSMYCSRNSIAMRQMSRFLS